MVLHCTRNPGLSTIRTAQAISSDLQFLKVIPTQAISQSSERLDMTPPPDPGCAVNPDVSLKDTSEIDWSFDKEDETPLTVAGNSLGSTSGPAISESEPSQTFHPFFMGHAQAPAIFVAGSRRSGRAICPSNRVVDPDNAMNSAPGPSSTKSKVVPGPLAVTGKRKAPAQRSSRCVVQKTDHTSEDSDDNNSDVDTSDHIPSKSMHASGESTDIEAPSENAAVVSEQEYALLKAMADADHEVSTTSSSTSKICSLNLEAIHRKSKSDATADVRTIFRRDKDYKNPDTAKVQDGNWCKLCL